MKNLSSWPFSGNNHFTFVTSVTVDPSTLHRLLNLLLSVEKGLSALAHVLITPLFASPRTLDMIRDLKERYGVHVYFDSGGYYVQIGRIRYEDLYYPLLRFYKENRWADVYTLPDHVPTSQDTPEQVWNKVMDTTNMSKAFFEELPDDLKEKAMPVVQGHTFDQIAYCLETFLAMGVSRIGFGSFGTSGAKQEVNNLTANSKDLAQWVIQEAHQYGAQVHFFGLGVPALVPLIYLSGASSFDSSSWLKSAGFGQVFLPFTRAYNITYRSTSSCIQQGVTWEQFVYLKEVTSHSCPYCESWDIIYKSKYHRAVHNLLVLQETVQRVTEHQWEHIRRIYEESSPKYYQEFSKWVLQT